MTTTRPRLFQIAAGKINPSSALFTYVETVTAYPVKGGWSACSAMWGFGEDVFPEARTAAVQLAYSARAAVQAVTELS